MGLCWDLGMYEKNPQSNRLYPFQRKTNPYKALSRRVSISSSKGTSVGQMTHFTGEVEGWIFSCFLLVTLWHHTVQQLQIVQTNATWHWKVKVFAFHNWVPPLKISLPTSSQETPETVPHCSWTHVLSPLAQTYKCTSRCSDTYSLWPSIWFFNYLTGFLLLFGESAIAHFLCQKVAND